MIQGIFVNRFYVGLVVLMLVFYACQPASYPLGKFNRQFIGQPTPEHHAIHYVETGSVNYGGTYSMWRWDNAFTDQDSAIITGYLLDMATGNKIEDVWLGLKDKQNKEASYLYEIGDSTGFTQKIKAGQYWMSIRPVGPFREGMIWHDIAFKPGDSVFVAVISPPAVNKNLLYPSDKYKHYVRSTYKQPFFKRLFSRNHVKVNINGKLVKQKIKYQPYNTWYETFHGKDSTSNN